MSIKTSARKYSSHFIALFIGLAITSFFAIAGISASQSTLIAANQNLRQFWRTTYDILVRPTNSRTSVENKYGLVEADYLSGINGGISFQQFEQIESIPGVDVAAPIATVGYFTWLGDTKPIGQITEPGAYVLEEKYQFGDPGTPDRTQVSYYLISPGEPMNGNQDSNGVTLHVNPPPDTMSSNKYQTGILVAGIEPSQEAKLIGIDKAVINGEYLKDNEPLSPVPYLNVHSFCEVDPCPEVEINLPMLVNDTPYIEMTVQATLKRLSLPLGVNTYSELMTHGGIGFLASLPSATVDTQTTDSAWSYQNLLKNIKRPKVFAGSALWGLPAALNYQEIVNPFNSGRLALEIVMPEVHYDTSCPTCSVKLYRLLVIGNSINAMTDSLRLNAGYRNDYIGTFDITRLPKPMDVNRVPLETYYPPVVQLVYNEQGNPVDPPKELLPTNNPAGYIQSPPLILTTLEAARALRGDDSISAIRVRVAGIDELTPSNQRKIEAVASEIVRRTNLDVDIMVGSSPTKVLVHAPGVGYVEEQWIQKNVTVAYQKKVQAGHWLLLGALLVIGSFYTLDTAWAGMEAKRWMIALQKALGWRSTIIFRQMMGETLLAAVLASILGGLGALGAAHVFGWQVPSLQLLAAMLVGIVLLALIGGLYPAWAAALVPPIVGLQQGNIRQHLKGGAKAIGGVWAYAWEGLLRRFARTLLNVFNAALSAGLLTLFFGVLLEQQGAFSGTLLGEFILVEVKPFQLAIAGVGLLLSGLSVTNNLIASVRSRRREIGVLKALGWRNSVVIQLPLTEGIVIGLMGGLAGTFIGLCVYIILYRVLSLGLLWVGLAGVGLPFLVGSLAGLYPAWLAARVLPAEAVRYE